MTFGEVLIKLMEEKGVSQSELAKRSGIGKSTINELVKGRSKEPTFSKGGALADALGVTMQSIYDLMTRDEEA